MDIVMAGCKILGYIYSLPGTTFFSSAKIKGLIDELEPFRFLAISFIIIIVAVSCKRKGIGRRHNRKIGWRGITV